MVKGLTLHQPRTLSRGKVHSVVRAGSAPGGDAENLAIDKLEASTSGYTRRYWKPRRAELNAQSRDQITTGHAGKTIMSINFFRDHAYSSLNERLIRAARENDFLYLVNHIYNQDHKHPEEFYDEAMENRISLQLIKRELSLLPSRNIIDVGSSNSNLLAELAQMGHRVIGVDISPVRVLKNRKKQGQPLDIRFGLAEDLPVKDNSADVVISTETLEHVFDLDRTIGEFARVLHPQGLRKLFAQVPLMNASDGDNHLRHFTPSTLQACLHTKGFDIDECTIIPYLTSSIPDNIFVKATLRRQ